MGGDIHSAIEIKTMRCKALDAGIEREMLATILPGVLDEPIEERGAESTGAIGIVRYQIVDVEGAAGEEHIENAKAGHRSNDPIKFEISQLVSLFLLLEDARCEINCFNVRPQFSHYRTALADLLRRVGQRDLPQRWLEFGHEIPSPVAQRDQGPDFAKMSSGPLQKKAFRPSRS